MSEERPVESEIPRPGPGEILSLESVFRVVDDWEQDYFVPVSFPTHIKNHIDQALAQLRARLKALIP